LNDEISLWTVFWTAAGSSGNETKVSAPDDIVCVSYPELEYDEPVDYNNLNYSIDYSPGLKA
jgi:hypothetical protein